MSRDDALAIAEEKNLDLVEINPNMEPPLCKILDYGKYLYKQKKQQQEAKKKVKQTEVKTIRMGYRTSEHDMATKERKARQFIDKGNLVKLQVIGRGRELAYKDFAVEKVKNFIANLEDVATVDSPPKFSGNTIITILKPIK